MATHEIKCWPEFFDHLASGEKRFELRFDDRGYHAGDILIIKEWLPQDKVFTGRKLRKLVTYLLRDGFALANGYVCMSLDDLRKE